MINPPGLMQLLGFFVENEIRFYVTAAARPIHLWR